MSLTGSHGGGEHAPFSDPLFFQRTTPVLGSPDTPGRVRPDKAFELDFFNRSMTMPDGRDVEFWGFEDRLHPPADGRPVVRPSSPLRVVEGDIVHVTLHARKRQHTLHLHGIEIDTYNDGVGHTSFEVTGSYTYQFRAGAPFRPLRGGEPQTRGAGTFFYHCHVNTTLHFQMGMYGGLFVDPVEGPGTAFHQGPRYDPAQERGWGAGDVDPEWHRLGHAAGGKGEDVGLNDFHPVYFDLTGVFQPMRRGRVDPTAVIEDPRVAAVGDVGGLPVFVRYGNVSYTRQRVSFSGIADGSLAVQVISADGRPLDGKPPHFARPFLLRGPLETTSAERYDLLLHPLRKGTSVVTVEYLHWITGRLLGVVRTTVTGT